MRLGDGAQLMRGSYQLVRSRPALLWFPLASTGCLVLVSGFWIYESAWLYAANGPRLLFVPLVLAGLYTLMFIGIFFNVGLAACADEALAGRETSFGEGVSLAWSRFGAIAGWSAYSLFVAFVVGLISRWSKWAGRAAEVAWNFATFFVVPLIALEGLDSSTARQRSMQLAAADWQEEAGGLGALQATLLIPMVLFALDGKLLFSGHVHSGSGRALLGLGLLCGFAVGTAASVVRQVFAVTLYRNGPTGDDAALAA
jgi:hypothetical protein